MNDNNNLEMNEQLAFMEANDKKVAVGDVVKGEVISINENEVFLNINYKADGILPRKEANVDDNQSLSDAFKLGEEFEVKVINRRDTDGYVVLSRVELEREESYKKVSAAFNAGENILVKVKSVVNGGLIANYHGARVFIPASQIDIFHVEDLNSYIGKEFEVKLLECKKERFVKIVASRKELLKAARKEKEDAAWATVEVGGTYEGEVKRLTSFGAFVEVNGVDGLLHVSEISWGKINRPQDALKVGEKVNVAVLELDKENRKLSLSMKKLIENPWSNIEEKYLVGNVVLGKVARFAKFGAFVELEPGIDALVHISQISNTRINTPADALTVGEEVKAKILEVDKENKKIALSIKEVSDN